MFSLINLNIQLNNEKTEKMVGMEGVEPPRLTALEPKSSVSASSTTSPADCLFYMTKARIKPKIAKITHIIVSF